MVSDTLRVLHITFSFAETVVVERWNLMHRWCKYIGACPRWKWIRLYSSMEGDDCDIEQSGEYLEQNCRVHTT